MINFKIGDSVRVVAGAKYVNDIEVPEGIRKLKLFIRAVKINGVYTVARAKTGPVLGDINEMYLISGEENIAAIEPYDAFVPEHDFPLYHSPSKNSGVIKRVKRGFFTIVDERNGFGKVKVGAGWLDLSKVKVFGNERD